MGKDVLTDGRTVYISGQIDDEMQETRRQIRQLVLEDPTAPIRLVINSEGGAVIGAFAILDEMEAIRADPDTATTFIGVVEGQALSAALTILQGCDRRIAGSFSILMAHGVTGGSRGDTLHRQAFERFIGIVHQRMAKLYARRTGMHIADWLRAFESDTPQFSSPETALTLGLIDEIAGA
jgi:ATP-dependent Clp endopeptidase proteolytic subunit ClpP